MGPFQLKIFYDFVVFILLQNVFHPLRLFSGCTLLNQHARVLPFNNTCLCYLIKSQDTLCRYSAAHLTPTTWSYKFGSISFKKVCFVRSKGMETIFRDMLIYLESQNHRMAEAERGTKIIKFQSLLTTGRDIFL